MSVDQHIHDSVIQACRMEVLSPKPGNVSPGNEFTNATVADFLKSAEVIAPVLASTEDLPLGHVILEAVRRTHDAVGHNTNLGIILLLAPLARGSRIRNRLQTAVSEVIASAGIDDSRDVYEAIRIAQPAGLGDAESQSVHDEPTLPLVDCMRLAADRDMIARQYSNGFREVFDFAIPQLKSTCFVHEQTSRGVITRPDVTQLAVRLLAKYDDSLILRKCGPELAATVRAMAAELLASGWPNTPDSATRYDQVDAFLRADGNQRNPGTTADLVATALFAGLVGRQLVCDPSRPLSGARS